MSELDQWLFKYFSETQGSAIKADSAEIKPNSYSLDDTLNHESEERKNPFDELVDIFISLITKKLQEGFDISISKEIYDETVKFMINHLKVIQNQENITLKEITEKYFSALIDIRKEGEVQFEPYEQVSPYTVNFISNIVADDYNLLGFVNFEYWKQKIYRNISKVKRNSNLLFSIKNLIGVLKSIINEKIRLKAVRKDWAK